jgi:hypothetical protein
MATRVIGDLMEVTFRTTVDMSTYGGCTTIADLDGGMQPVAGTAAAGSEPADAFLKDLLEGG